MHLLSRMVWAVLVMGIAAAPQPVPAADPTTYSINIPAQDLGTALLRFAAVTHQQIAFDQTLVRNYRSSALVGVYQAVEGLHVLIGAAPFLIGTSSSGVLIVSAAPTAAAAHSSGPASVAASADAATHTSAALAEVIVRAQGRAQRRVLRAKLWPKVTSFVYAVGTEGSALARWHARICPLVSGLSQQEGEFILERVSEIARSAGAPLADESCKPNLFILVHPRPKELLEAMEKLKYRATFGGAAPSAVEAFIATPRPVRVWYAYPFVTPGADFGTTGGGSFNVQGGGTVDNPGGGSPAAPAGGGSEGGSFWRIYIIVDSRQLHGVTLGQLADYLGMVGLAKFESTAHLGDAPTILKLFSGSPDAAPARMSEWDQAFLKALYGTEPQPFVQPRALLSLHMVREIVP
jgi:hypothetical protein